MPTDMPVRRLMESPHRWLLPKPIRYILNTSTHPAHVGGNVIIRKAGMTFVGGNITGTIADVGNGAAIAAHEGVLHRMTDANAPEEAIPTETYHGADYKLQGGMFFNDEGVQFFHPPTAHSDRTATSISVIRT